MVSMLTDIRGRALALAGCFDRGTRLWRAGAQEPAHLLAMGQVPREVIHKIATLARLSIIVNDLID